MNKVVFLCLFLYDNSVYRLCCVLPSLSHFFLLNLVQLLFYLGFLSICVFCVHFYVKWLCVVYLNEKILSSLYSLDDVFYIKDQIVLN